MKKLALILGIAMFLGLPAASFAQVSDQAPQNGQFQGKHHFMNGERKGQGLMNKLNLTQDQAAKAKAIREQSRSKIKSIVDQIKAERRALMEMRQQNATQDQLTAQKEKLKGLVDQAKSIHKQNLENFETILTPEQKTQFEGIKKQRMEKMKERRMKRGQGQGNFGNKNNFMQNK